ncbi:serine-rich adhesin for platelets [Manduca sexta]|uniref:serine-rich adhesin for platelets n=1 Tax=Manduca sexta TaxID=7130 RepID=UPI00188EBA19|nr:serine-rich adhesin for platelets [Manduca sexta]
MRVTLCVILITACALADTVEERRSKLPFVADAVGNTLPPPSNVPATVGSPINLLTPDRYEFYTFDESGELVKRLMTLEEIQAIVAAGEESEGLVTFANDDQPTIAFNISQPPHTKVHSVVTNVQNVLKAQMEAHKMKPFVQPTLDTPDVSDTWSLILPSIFGNTGADIVPDKATTTYTTPETETIEIAQNDYVDNSLTKEEGNAANVTTLQEKKKEPVLEESPSETAEVKDTSTSTVEVTPTVPVIISTTEKITYPPSTTTTTKKPEVSSTMKVTQKPATTTIKTQSTTTFKPTTQTSTTPVIQKSTAQVTSTTTPKVTTIKQSPSTIISTTKAQSIVTAKPVFNNVQDNIVTSTEKNEVIFEKISTFVPVSTVKYVTERTTHQPIVITTKQSTDKIASPTSKPIISTPTFVSSTVIDNDLDKINTTTITTQSVSPSTTISSTEIVVPEIPNLLSNFMGDTENKDAPPIPLFDVAQSISQIASDLGGNYRPIPTATSLLDVTKVNDDLESKEDFDMDMPTAIETTSDTKGLNSTDENIDNFVKISTLDPHPEKEKAAEKELIKVNKIKITTEAVEKIEITTSAPEGTTIDPILNESMGDLLSQVVNEAPQSIVDSEKITEENIEIQTTEHVTETTTAVNLEITTASVKINDEIFTTTEQIIEEDTTTTRVDTTTDNNLLVNDIKEFQSLHDVTTVASPEFANNKNKEYFVEISKSENKNTSNTEDNYDTTKNGNKTIETNLDKNNHEKVDKIRLENKFKDETKNEIPPVEITTIKIDQSTTSSINVDNKINATRNEIRTEVLNNNKEKESNTNKTDNTPNFVPKIEEFKKKIQKVNIADEELANERNNSWKLISTVSPPRGNEIPNDKVKSENHYVGQSNENKDIVLEFSKENQGLEVTTKDLGEDIAQFTELCNELAFRYWSVLVENIDKKRSFVLSPYSITSMLAMMFMGARGATSGEMNEILKLDDMVTFNPHFTLKNISDSIETTPESGVIVSAFIRELYSDRNRGKILTFYKERAQHFYNGHVEEINFKLISDIIRRRTNLLVKRYTWGKIAEYMKINTIVMQPPLAAFSANIFQSDCTGSSVDGRDGEMYFVVSPNVRQRRLVPVPAVVYKKGFLAGYDPVLDATASAIGSTNSVISTLFLMPGQQGNVVHAEDLERLERRLLDAVPSTPTWNRLLRTLLPRVGLELQIPRFSHKSVFNVSSSLRKMGLKDLFDAEHADLAGLNGPSKDLFLSDMIQMTTFVTCGEGVIGEQHHIEEYPESVPSTQKRRTSRWANYWDEPRDYQRAFHDPHDVGEAMLLPLHLRPRQARLPTRSAQPARLKYDRPFLFFVRHNPTGMILYAGRYNPRLLP